MKRDIGELVANTAVFQGLDKISSAYFTYIFIEPNKRRDPSNFIAGGIKLIEDGLQEAKILKNDGWKNILGIASYWIMDPECPGVLVLISEHRISREELYDYIEFGDEDW